MKIVKFCKICGEKLVTSDEKILMICLKCSTCSCGKDLVTQQELELGLCYSCRRNGEH